MHVVINARFPTKKAYGIQLAKMCEAFLARGVDLTLVIPRTRASAGSAKDMYGLGADIPTVRLPALDLYGSSRIGFALSSLVFMGMSLIYLAWLRMQGRLGAIYTIDMDTFSYALLPAVGPTVAEMHSPKRSTLLSRFFFKRAKLITTNPLIAQEFKKTFGIESLIEPNGVDESFFNLAGQGGGALYVGRFYKWKGLEVLPPAQAASGIPFHILGGTREEFEKVFGPAGNLQFAEAEPNDVPQWLARADVLLLVGTAKNQESNRYTAPMKVFEYLATGKPIVASETEALKSLMSPGLVQYCTPDDPQALGRAVQEALADPSGAERRMAYAHEHTWARRAQRILNKLLHTSI